MSFQAPDGTILVDSGPHGIGILSGSKVHTLFNTHYHLDQTGNNELVAAAGAKIIAHLRTQEWMSSDYWVPGEERYEKARPKAAPPHRDFPDHRFHESGRRKIDYG